MYFADDTLFNIPSLIPYSAVLKYNASGIPQWGIGYYANSYNTYISDMLINPQQDLMVCGWSEGTGQFGNFTLPAFFSASTILPYVAKVNPAGLIQWYKTDGQDGVGSTYFNKIAMTPSGDYAVTGYYPPEVGFQVSYRLGCFQCSPW